MSDTFTLTISSPLRIGASKPYFNKWDIVTAAGGRGIVIRVSNEGVGYVGATKMTIYPYPNIKKKWIFRLWFKWLKLRVWIGDFYK